MIHVKRFIDRVSSLDNKLNRDLVMPIAEARMLRDEIAKLLADIVENSASNTKSVESVPSDIRISGGKW